MTDLYISQFVVQLIKAHIEASTVSDVYNSMIVKWVINTAEMVLLSCHCHLIAHIKCNLQIKRLWVLLHHIRTIYAS